VLRRFKEDLAEDFEFMKTIFEGDKLSEKDVLEILETLRSRYERLDRIFGEKVKGTEQPIYEGKIPVWLHPHVIPELIDTSLDKVERRLEKWGLIESGAQPSQPEDLMKFPERPHKKEVEEGGEEEPESEES